MKDDKIKKRIRDLLVNPYGAEGLNLMLPAANFQAMQQINRAQSKNP